MSSGSIRIIQLPEKSSVNTDDYMAVDSSANGTKKVKFTDLLDNNLSAQNKAADAQATGEAINDISARVDNMINTQQNASVTTLWTGTLNTYNQEVTLSDDVSNYDFIDIYVSQLDYKFIRRPVNSLTGIQIQGQNMLDSGSTDNIQFWEGGLNISGNKAKIVKANSMTMYGSNTYQKPTAGVNTSIPSITRIDGVKIGHTDNDEIVDARVGANGKRYPTLGDAIRGQVTDLKSDLNHIGLFVEYPFDLVWANNKYILASDGSDTGYANGYACTEEYYPVKAGQQLAVNLYANGFNECTVAYYDESKSFLSYITGTGESIITVPSNGYARFTTKTSKITTDDAYVKNYIEDEILSESDNFTYFGIDRSADVCKETVNNTYCKTPVIRKTYKGNLNRQKRFLAIGFDDLRVSDINMIMPLFEKYKARATFNKVYNDSESSPTEKLRTERVFMGDHELGDHTFLHYSFPYFDPLWNGQNPSSLDGTQTPFPTNEDFRSDVGNGKNVFGKTLTSTVNMGGVSGVTWANLTDAQCQTIREHYSVIKNPTMSVLLDTLSNKYLGTSGISAGSYDNNTGKYTGGLFTGCSTSANHEVWERILELISRYNKEALNVNWDMYTWSRPGSEVSNLRVTYNSASYYDPDHLYLESPQTRFVSSLTGEDRSWTDALLNCGYKVTHDYPVTGNMNYYWVSRQMYFNAFLSKRDAIANMTNKTVNYATLGTAYPESFFTGTKSKAAQMYDVNNGQFRKFVEELRKNTANGLIWGEMIDSTDNYSFRVFFENALRYCQSAGIELITKAEAYNIAFENVISDGNLIGNENLRNTAQEFIKDSENMPTNPDGYVGNCSVTFDANGIPTLVTSGETYFIVFGAPYGKLKFTADVKGTGTIKFRGLRNNKEISAGDYQHTLLSTITVNSDSDYTAQETVFVVPMAAIESYEPYYEGYGNRICAVKIIYSAGLEVKNIRMVVN